MTRATVAGGDFNRAVQQLATVGGGGQNTASGLFSTVAGGSNNTASAIDSTVGGGSRHTASGRVSTVPGGSDNQAGGDYSFAAGRRAKVRDAATVGDSDGDEGTFVWADSENADFTSTGPNQFLIRASGGVGIGTNSPGSPLQVENPSTASNENAVHGIMTSTSPGGFSAAVRGENRGTGGNGIGVWGSQNGTGWGVAGSAESGGCDFAAIGGGTDYCTFSSIRWKRNVRNIDGPLEKVARLRGVYFDWDGEHGGKHDIGMIAEEVGKILPEIVNFEENGVDANGMDYSKLTPLLVEAVKTLNAKLERLEAQQRSTSATGDTVRAGVPIVLVGLIGLAALRRRSARAARSLRS